MRNFKLLDFVDKFIHDDFVVWCPDFSHELYCRNEIFETQIIDDSDSICIFDYFIVDDICVNGVIQINCHFNSRSYIKAVKELDKSNYLNMLYPSTLLDLLGDTYDR